MLEPGVGATTSLPLSPSRDPQSNAASAPGAEAAEVGDWAVFWLDLSGKVARWGERPASLFSATREDVVGTHVADLFSAETRASGVPERALRDAHDYGGWDGMCSLGVPGARCRQFSVNITYVTTPNGLAIGYVVVARLVDAPTEAPPNERRLIEAGRLAGDVAHEVGNLFAAIRGFAGVLETVLPTNGTSHQVWHELVKACDRGKHLTRRLLEAGRNEPVEAIDLAAEVSACEPVLRQVLPRDIQLVVRVGRSLPLVRGRQCEVQSILMNLVLNARDAIEGEGIVQISAVARTDPGTGRRQVELIVQDSGRGMPAQIAARAFERFFTTKGGFGGAGVGLSVVQEAVSSMGGTVELEKAHPKGTRARVLIPSALSAPAGNARRPVELFDHGVLVLASDRVLRDCIEDLLVRQGVAVETASGEIDVRLLERTPLAILVPESLEEGESTLARLRAAEPGIQVLMVSEDSSEATRAAGVTHLTPRFTPSELIEAVRALPAEDSLARSAVN